MNKTELRKYLNDRYGRSEAASPLMTFGNPAVSVHDVIVDVDESDKDNPTNIMLTDILDGIGSGGSGGSDYAEKVKTIDGSMIEFFVGEQTNYEKLTAEEKEDLLAIITNDEMRTQVIDGIEELMAWKNQAKHYIYEFGDYPQLKKGSDFYIGNFPKNGALAGIVGIGLEIIYEQTVGEPHYMRFSANKVTEVTNIMNHSTRRYEVRFCATAGFTNDTGACGTASMNLVVGAKGNELYITFENGSLLWMDDSEGAGSIKQGIERLDDGNFYLSSVSYCFA